MPDDQNLSQQDIQDLQQISASLPAGHPTQKKISVLLNAQPTQFERQRSGREGIMGTLKHMLPDPTGGRSVFDPKAWYDYDQAGFHPTGPGTAFDAVTRPLPEDLQTEALGAGRTGGNAIYRGASLFAPLAGVSPGNMESASAKGDTSGVATQAAVPAALAISGPFLHSQMSDVGNRVASTLRNPATARQSQLGKPGTVKDFLPPQLQKWSIPPGMIPKGDVGTPTNPGPFMEIPAKMPKVAAPEPELGSVDNPGWMSKLPNKLPPALQGDPFAPAQQPTPFTSPFEAQSAEGVKGSVPKPSGRLVVLPQEAQALDQLQKIATTRASQHGMQYAAGMRPAGGGRVPMTPTVTNTVEFPQRGNVTPFEAPQSQMSVETKMGIRWAVSPDGQYRVSIPNGVPDEGIFEYAGPKLAEQAQIHASMPWMKKAQ